MRTLNKRRACRDQAPGDHDAGYPDACPVALHGQVAGHFDQEVGKEEQAAGEAEHLGRELQVLVHLQGSHADIAAIDDRDQVADDQKGQQSPGDTAHGAAFEFIRQRCC
ncbi:hypothetical protein PPS11_00120 [Pseudomonas putida S11]|nr:hypothetical protein PPS11_00120 [Pseudomonas putida S11]